MTVTTNTAGGRKRGTPTRDLLVIGQTWERRRDHTRKRIRMVWDADRQVSLVDDSGERQTITFTDKSVDRQGLDRDMSAPYIAAQLATAHPMTTNEGSHMLYRQGDVLLRRVPRIPTGLVPVPLDQGRVILAYGEVTGHAHQVVGDVEFLAADLDEMSRRFLRVLDEATVVHDEHDTIVLPPGCYQVVRQREYTPDAIRNVAD